MEDDGNLMEENTNATNDNHSVDIDSYIETDDGHLANSDNCEEMAEDRFWTEDFELFRFSWCEVVKNSFHEISYNFPDTGEQKKVHLLIHWLEELKKWIHIFKYVFQWGTNLITFCIIANGN